MLAPKAGVGVVRRKCGLGWEKQVGKTRCAWYGVRRRKEETPESSVRDRKGRSEELAHSFRASSSDMVHGCSYSGKLRVVTRNEDCLPVW